jgi:F420-dependent oxidoreductase-like protein
VATDGAAEHVASVCGRRPGFYLCTGGTSWLALASPSVRLGFYMGYAPPGTSPLELIALAQEAERLGYDSAWAAEAWGTDAVTVLSWLAATTSELKIGSAIMQMPGRTPVNTAMTAATLDLLSGGRFLLGLGTSGPQVVEGWHGQPWGKPLTRTREYVELVRMALRRETVELHGDQYQVPYSGDSATGLGKPLKLMLRPLRSEIPIYLAALSPKNVRLAFEIADGWLPIYFSPERAQAAFGYEQREGFDIAPSALVVVTDDVETARDMIRPVLALYVGGMGARGANFYNALVRRYGYEAEAERIQELYLDGKQREAIAAVPDTLVDDVALVGPKERIADRLDAWRDAGVTTLLVSTRDVTALRTMAELVL